MIYYKGNGSPQPIAGNVIKDLIQSPKFQAKHMRIIAGKTKDLEGNFSVDLTWKRFDFFVGRTNVNYSIKIVGANAIVTYTMFVKDGFWDPNFIGEKVGTSKTDEMGPNLETPLGHPYPFIPVTGTATFPNPGYRQ